jgi:hypothetical protein
MADTAADMADTVVGSFDCGIANIRPEKISGELHRW